MKDQAVSELATRLHLREGTVRKLLCDASGIEKEAYLAAFTETLATLVRKREAQIQLLITQAMLAEGGK